MISSMNMYIIFIATYISAYHETLPSWVITCSFILMMALHIVNYSSEQKLRDTIAKLETATHTEEEGEQYDLQRKNDV